MEKLIMKSAAEDEADSEEIDRILKLAIRKLTEGTAETGGENRNRNEQRSREKQKWKESDHTRLSRFQYARYQELYNKCPRKLIDMAVVGVGLEAGKQTKLPD